jgi:hypothetical protein
MIDRTVDAEVFDWEIAGGRRESPVPGTFDRTD